MPSCVEDYTTPRADLVTTRRKLHRATIQLSGGRSRLPFGDTSNVNALNAIHRFSIYSVAGNDIHHHGIMASRPCDLSFWLGNRGWLTLYRQLFAWIVVANLTVAILASAGACDWASKRRVQFAVANTLFTLLTRNEVRRFVI